jgi:hexosaminidase
MFTMKKWFPFLLLIFTHAEAQIISVTPQPARIITLKGGPFILNGSTQLIVHGNDQENAALYFKDFIKQYYGLNLLLWKDKNAGANAIHFIYSSKTGNTAGSYALTINGKGITIESGDGAGLFYGVQTLLQLLPSEKAARLALPYVNIKDQPRFAYRGLMLDAGRYFLPISFVKRAIDYLAQHKMNYLHWHLTEDQGWRIEIKKYPLLTAKGSVRNGTIIGKYPGKGNNNIPHKGYYSQEEIKDVINYAAKRYVTIIPEIEMPGHASAAIAAYPFLSCFPDENTKIPDNMISEASRAAGNGKKVQETWGVQPDVFCAGKDSVFTFLADVIDEVAALFPSSYIHVGGDECPKANWKRCPRCQQRIKDEKLANEHELQSYFIRRMEEHINKKGKSLIGWDEILEGGLAPNAIVMSWRGEKGGIEAAKQQHNVIMTPNTYVYFDYSQLRNDDTLTIGGYLPLQRVYSYNPISKEMSANDARYVLGGQANLWTEYISTSEKAEYMLFPRLSALSESLWSEPAKKDWASFEKRLPALFRRYTFLGINYCKKYE